MREGVISLQIDRPVRGVHERLPAHVLRLAQLDREQRAALRADRFLGELHAGLLGRAAPFADVALHARADQVFPARSTTTTRRHHVVEAQFAGGKLLATVLAHVRITSKDVPPIQTHTLLGQAIVVQQSQDAGHANFEIHAANPIVAGLLEFCLHLADFSPRVKIVVAVLAILDMNDLGHLIDQQAKRAANADHVYRHILAV